MLDDPFIFQDIIYLLWGLLELMPDNYTEHNQEKIEKQKEREVHNKNFSIKGKMYFFILILIAPIFAIPNCPQYIRPYCNTLPPSSACSNYFQFGYNTTTAAVITIPRVCYNPGASTCFPTSNPAIQSCIPPCGLFKTGGPSGLECEDITNQATCVQSYAHKSGGDRWCEWVSGSCIGTVICHD